MKREKKNLFQRAAMFFYKQCCIRGLPLFTSGQVERDLTQLHPGENIQYLKTEYYVKKLSLTLMILFVGALFGVAAKYVAAGKLLLQEDGSLPRGSYRDGIVEIEVTAELKDELQEFKLKLWPQVLSHEETANLADAFFVSLPELIAEKNESLTQVRSDLKLEESYLGYPFRVEWESSRPEIVSSNGSVSPADEEVQVELTVTLSYESYTRAETVDIIVLPLQLTYTERLHRDLEEYLIFSEQGSRDQEKWELPDRWQESDIRWSQKIEDNSLLLLTAALAVAVLVYLFSDRDLHEQLEKRKRLLRREYPDLVHQLVLFVGAGMTVRGAFGRIASDYEKKQEKSAKPLPAYEEMIHTCRELQSGVSEGAAYEHFGRRTGLQEYIRLSTLLMQNLKRGNATLIERLREEAEKAGEERLMQSKRLGEEAGTKLLLPMVLMLGVVMVMIMVPAFSTM